MKRQIIGFLSLFGLVVGLSTYYVLMPTVSKKQENNESIVNGNIENATSVYYEMMSLERESFYVEAKNGYTNILISGDSSIEEKTNAIKEIENLNKIQTLEKGLQNALKNIDYPYSFVQIDGDTVNITVEKEDATSLDAANIFTEATIFLENENLEIIVEFHS